VVVHRLGRRLRPAQRLARVALPRFFTGIHQSARPRPPLDPDPDNLLSTHTSSVPPPHDSQSSVCPTKIFPGPTFPQPGNTLCMPSTRAAVQRHTPTPLTPSNPDRTNSEPSQSTSNSSHGQAPHIPTSSQCLATRPIWQDPPTPSTTTLPQSLRIQPSLSTRRPRRFPPNFAQPTPTTMTLPPPPLPRRDLPTAPTFLAGTRDSTSLAGPRHLLILSNVLVSDHSRQLVRFLRQFPTLPLQRTKRVATTRPRYISTGGATPHPDNKLFCALPTASTSPPD
jgi:hypothetical protein